MKRISKEFLSKGDIKNTFNKFEQRNTELDNKRFHEPLTAKDEWVTIPETGDRNRRNNDDGYGATDHRPWLARFLPVEVVNCHWHLVRRP